MWENEKLSKEIKIIKNTMEMLELRNIMIELRNSLANTINRKNK